MWDDFLNLVGVTPLLTMCGFIAYYLHNGEWLMVPYAVGVFVVFAVAFAGVVALGHGAVMLYQSVFGSTQS